MKYTVRKSIIHVVGKTWGGHTAAMSYTLSDTDVRHCKDDQGRLTPTSVGYWLRNNSGDFQDLTDWAASLEDGDDTVDIPWSTEAGELAFYDCVNGESELV
jgi:hypothetical protein